MANEIELKLALPQAAQRALLRHPLLKLATARSNSRLINRYYDTPTLHLHRHRIALRLRRQGRRWLQTVKCAGDSAAGLSTRPEWETPYGGAFDFSAVDDAKVRRRLTRDKVLPRLAPVFETNFLRTTWRIEPAPGVVLLLTLDRGRTVAGERQEAISEIEIEIAAGAPSHVFALARKLAKTIPLAPAAQSKAERGYRQFRGDDDSPAKAGHIALTPQMPPLAGFRSIALACLDQLQRNHAGAATSDDPEYIHQMRVATRRLRAALRLFAPLLPAGFEDALLPALRRQATLLGEARDMDVLQAEIAAPVQAALADEPRVAALASVIDARRQRQRQVAKDHLRGTHFGELMLLAGDLLHQPPFVPPPPPELPGPGTPAALGTLEPPPMPATLATPIEAVMPVAPAVSVAPATPHPETLATFAQGRIGRLRKKVLKLARAAHIDDPASLHALRIGIKRLRYALEFFASLAPGKTLRKRLKHLSDLQETLGQLNDLANAGRLLMTCAGDDSHLREAVSLIGGWHGARYAALLASVPKKLARLHALKLPPLDA